MISVGLGASVALTGLWSLFAVMGLVYSLGLLAKPQLVFPLTIGLMPIVEQLSGAGLTVSVAGMAVSPQLAVRLVVVAYMAFYLGTHLVDLRGWRYLGIGMALAGFAIVSTVLRGAVMNDVVAVSKVGYWLLMIPFVSLLAKESQATRSLLVAAALWGSVAAGLSVVLGKMGFLPERYSRYGLGESYGLFANPHAVALSLAMALFLALMAYSEGRYRRTSVVAGVVAVVGSLLTLVRTGAVAIVAGLSVYGFASLRRSNRELRGSVRRSLVLSAALVLVGGLTVGALGSAWLIRWSDFESLDTAGAGRPVVYRAAMSAYLERDPLEQVLGAGFDKTAAEMSVRIGAAIGAHNDLLDLLLGWGALGVLLYVAVLASIAVEAYKRCPVQGRPALAGAILAYAVGAMVNGLVFNVSAMTYFAVVLGLAIAGGSDQEVDDAGRDRQRTGGGLA
jgi:O-antigen ligase